MAVGPLAREPVALWPGGTRPAGPRLVVSPAVASEPGLNSATMGPVSAVGAGLTGGGPAALDWKGQAGRDRTRRAMRARGWPGPGRAR